MHTPRSTVHSCHKEMLLLLLLPPLAVCSCVVVDSRQGENSGRERGADKKNERAERAMKNHYGKHYGFFHAPIRLSEVERAPSTQNPAPRL